MSALTVLQNINVASMTTFHIDATCKYFFEATKESEILTLLKDQILKKNPLLVIGGGSNLLFINNFEGLVLKNSLKGIKIINENENEVIVKCAAGENWHEFVLYCIDQNWSGVENLSLIPGTVGASPMQNIGAYGVEIKDVFESLEAIEIATGNTKKFNKIDCQFGYRESVFKNELKNQFIITQVYFKLSKNQQINKSYGAIEQILIKNKITEPTIKDISNAVIEIRSSKLPDPKKIGNAGSFFKNPEISIHQFQKLKTEFPTIVGYETAKGIKLAAGWLIEQSGWKGYRDGDAGVHKDQALVMVNYGNAKGKEIYDLAIKVKNSVFEKFGVEINPEVNLVT